MNKVSDLITRYHQIQPDSKDEEFGKIGILTELEYLSDPQILPFLLERLGDKNDYDLARIEILKILSARNNNSSEHRIIAGAIRTILQSVDDDDFVKQWAAQEADHYIDDNDLILTLLETILNSEEDLLVRENALVAIKKKGFDARSVEKLKNITIDEEDDERKFLNRVNQMLNEWETKSNF